MRSSRRSSARRDACPCRTGSRRRVPRSRARHRRPRSGWSSPAGEQHFLLRRGQGQQVLDELVACAGPVDADQDLAAEPGGDLPQGRGQHFLMVGERVRAGVARSQQHGQALAGIGEPGAQRVAVALLPGGSGSFLAGECAVTRVASMSMTSHPARVFPAMASQGNPAGVSWISFQACARVLARARAILSSMAAVPARSSARRTAGPLGASPSTGARCASRAMSLMLVAPSAIAAASDASTFPCRAAATRPSSAAPRSAARSVPSGRRPCGAGWRQRGRPARFLPR